MILFPYAGDTRGGSVQSSFLLIEELLRRGRGVKLAFHGEGYARDLADLRRLPYVGLPALGFRAEQARKDRFRFGNLGYFITCLRVLKKHDITLVHVNDKRMLRTWCLPSAAAGKTLIAHSRGIYFPSWSVDLGFRLASRIICVSTYSRDLLPAWALAKSEVVHNPFKRVLTAEQRNEARRSIREGSGIPLHAAVIGFFGSLLRNKRPHVLLQVLERINTTLDGRPVYGIVCGETLEPRDDLYFSLLQTRSGQGRLVQAGFVANVADWMAACDVLIAPFTDEPFGRVAVEAQLEELPAIVSDDAGLREIVEDDVSGVAIDPYDLDAWVASVKRVLNDPIFASGLREGGRRAAARFTVERHADAVEAIYSQFE